MYSIKLARGKSMSMDTLKIGETMYAELYWEDEEAGTKSMVAYTASCVWTPKSAKWAESWARKKGLDLKADYGAYLRKHGERKEVVRKREEDAKRAENRRIGGIRQRCAEKWELVIAAMKEFDPPLGRYLETGEQ